MAMVRIAAGLALLAAGSAPAMAAPEKGKPGYDAERQICKSRPVVGSRVQRMRTCMTAQQWDETKLQERMGMLRRQTNGDSGCNYNPGLTGACGIQNGGRDTPF